MNDKKFGETPRPTIEQTEQQEDLETLNIAAIEQDPQIAALVAGQIKGEQLTSKKPINIEGFDKETIKKVLTRIAWRQKCTRQHVNQYILDIVQLGLEKAQEKFKLARKKFAAAKLEEEKFKNINIAAIEQDPQIAALVAEQIKGNNPTSKKLIKIDGYDRETIKTVLRRITWQQKCTLLHAKQYILNIADLGLEQAQAGLEAAKEKFAAAKLEKEKLKNINIAAIEQDSQIAVLVAAQIKGEHLTSKKPIKIDGYDRETIRTVLRRIAMQQKYTLSHAKQYILDIAELDLGQAQARLEDAKEGQELERKKSEKEKEARKELDNYVKELSEATTLNAQEFQKLIGLFGSANAVDILYRLKPEFRGIPVEYVKKVLANYLGDFLAKKSPFSLANIEAGQSYLSESNLALALEETIKEASLTYYNQQRKKGDTREVLDIIEEYISQIEGETYNLDNKVINIILEQVLEYYNLLLEQKKPDNIVGTLKDGRVFPDLNQLINIQEMEDKKKMLIADEMGLGKSASAILAKEYLGLTRALVVVPANVIPTWENFLSDNKDKDGNQIGYFQPGAAPKVLIINSIEDLEQASQIPYDYIVISQERLTDEYTKKLHEINYDMMIIDEVHRLKNLREGKRTANLIELSKSIKGDEKYMALLSGTPIPNKVEDIATSLRLLYPEKFEVLTDEMKQSLGIDSQMQIPEEKHDELINRWLVNNIIKGEITDLRSLLVPRMQMKSLTDSIEMPALQESFIKIELSDKEKEIYEIIMDEDELTAIQKIQTLRQLILNPEILDLAPAGESSKINEVKEQLAQEFKKNDKVVMFVNDYVEGVIRGNKNIIDQLEIPANVVVRVIEGEVSTMQRSRIQNELKEDKKMLLLVSGQTAGVGVDFSAANSVFFYNEPWTKSDYEQQRSRVYREGLENDLEVKTFITQNTIEQGIHEYIEAKQKAVEKLLKGVPTTDLEKRLLEEDEKKGVSGTEVNGELAKYYFSSWDRLIKIFAHVKEMGEEEFKKFIAEYGEHYAECYLDLGSRSYQANGARVSGTLIDKMANENGQKANDLRILDIGSGPEMLKNHISDEYAQSMYSLDINEHHFKGEGGKRVIGSFGDLPFAKESFDYANFSLALHYTKFSPSQNEFERIKVLKEMNRVLKEGGKAVINLIYSLNIEDKEKFEYIVEMLGFRIKKEASGNIDESNYKSNVITLEKVEDVELELEDVVELIGKENFSGLKFRKNKTSIKDSRQIITDFKLGSNIIPINFNKQDKKIYEEEQEILKAGQDLKNRYGSIEEIPRDEVIRHNFSRFFNGKRYVLFRKLEKGEGSVVIKQAA